MKLTLTPGQRAALDALAVEAARPATDLTAWEEANPEFVKGWDAALRGARELQFHATCKEFGLGYIAYDSPHGRVLGSTLRLLRRPTVQEKTALFEAFPQDKS